MTKTVDFYFDFGSPAAYLAYTQLPKICTDAQATINWNPMLLGGVFQATGNQSPAAIPAKGKYMAGDLQRFARRYDVPFNHNPHFPINTMILMRGAVGLQMRQDPRFDAYVRVVFEAMWVEGSDLNDLGATGAMLHKAGFDSASMLGLASQQEVKDRLKVLTQRAVERGIFGAPTMFVGGEMFWGQDRLDFVREALA